jgi:hypothetical protein
MVTLDWETERTDGVTLVRLYVTSEYRRRVRVENRLDGPVWPPRREGQPAAGWDGDAFEGVVTPENRLVAGYATSAQPADPPAEVVSEEPADPDVPPGPAGTEGFDPANADDRFAATDGGGATSTAGTTGDQSATNGTGGGQFRTGPDDGGGEGDDDPTPEAVVRSLGDPVVPREAVPVPDPGDDADSEEVGEADASPDSSPAESPTEGTDSDDGTAPDDGTEGAATAGAETGTGRAADERGGVEPGVGPDGATPPGTDAELVVPGAVRAWLRDVDRRLSAVERRRETETADPDPTLQVAVAGDRRALEVVAERVETLAGRATAVERRAGGDGRR